MPLHENAPRISHAEIQPQAIYRKSTVIDATKEESDMGEYPLQAEEGLRTKPEMMSSTQEQYVSPRVQQ